MRVAFVRTHWFFCSSCGIIQGGKKTRQNNGIQWVRALPPNCTVGFTIMWWNYLSKSHQFSRTQSSLPTDQKFQLILNFLVMVDNFLLSLKLTLRPTQWKSTWKIRQASFTFCLYQSLSQTLQPFGCLFVCFVWSSNLFFDISFKGKIMILSGEKAIFIKLCFIYRCSCSNETPQPSSDFPRDN